MGKLFVGVLLFSGLFGGRFAEAQSYSGYAPFPPIGNKAIQLAWKKIEACGLKRMSAFDPRLPAPLVPAQEAVVSARGQLLAYYMESYAGGFGAEFKNPTGGYGHSVWYTNGNIAFRTPYAGTVAHGNTFATVGGPGVNLYCQSTPVNSNQFLNCIEALWVNVVAAQLCQFAN